jgi:hypothetical protein
VYEQQVFDSKLKDKRMLLNREVQSELVQTHYDYHMLGFAEIYQESVNLCIWQRQCDTPIIRYASELTKKKHWSLRSVVNLNELDHVVYSALPMLNDEAGRLALSEDIGSVARLFADLFELSSVGIRLSVLDTTMCPRFHTDNVPCRLVTTYIGKGTEWLPEYAVDRTKLGHVSSGLKDSESGVYLTKSDIQQLNAGDVALMKGTGWNDYEAPITHRSPNIVSDERRLVLTLDFAH